MRLLKLSANVPTFRTVTFNRTGLSFVVAEQRAPKTSRTKTYNGVGKSLMLSILDFCLGSKNKPAFKTHLPGWVFYLDIELEDGTHTISRSADEPSEIFLNQTQITAAELKRFLERRSFTIPPNSSQLSFRALIGHFLRFGRGSYTDYRLCNLEEARNEYAVMLRNAFLLGLDPGLARHKQDLRRQQLKLFTDKVASERRLVELQKQADQRAVGMQTAETDRLALPIKELVGQYIASLRLRNANPDGIRIGEWLLNQLIDAGKWQRFSDITTASVESILPTVAGTAGYQNTYIKRLKAFVHWGLPDNWPDPVKKLKRVREKGAKKTRERRAATVEEAAAFFKVWPQLPPDRHLCYALAMLNGLRRNEIKRDDTDRLRWGQVHLDAVIPFVELKQKMGDGRDSIPLHPYVVSLLRERTPGLPAAPVAAAVPDMKTMAKDLKRAGIELADEQGRRLDFHALRHSFQTALDRTGCSRATKKKLMRHANEDVTDG